MTMLSTAVSSVITSITYPIRHEFAHTSPSPAQDQDLDRWGPANSHILVTGRDEREFTDTEDDFEVNDLIGRIVAVRPSRPASEQWYMSAENNPLGTGGAYLTGARVSPTPVNGRLYQELREMPGAAACSPFTLRYNDEEHRSDRANANNPWTIVWAQEGLEHQVDRPRITPPYAYVEVRSPLTPVVTGLASDEDIEAILTEVDEVAEAVANPTFITNSAIGHTLGKAAVNEDGNVELDPTRIDNEMYLTWFNATPWYDDHAVVQVWNAEAQRFMVLGYFNRGTDQNVYYHDDVYHDVRQAAFGAADREMHWARMGWEEPPAADSATERLEAMVEESRAAHESFEDLNDALNVLAREQSWCGEYERTMDFIGMRSRTHGGPRRPYDPENLLETPPERHAYDLQYTVDVTITDDSPGNRVTSALEYEYDAYTVSEVRFDASITVTITGVVAEDEDAAEELVTQSMIEAELDNLISAEFEINDYSHSDTSEDDDFDWDDYDG